jgi:N-acetylmuramoyl-L-alanine amidase
MRRRPRRQRLLTRLSSSVSRWSRNARLRWRTAEKYRWLGMLGVAVVVTTFGFLLNAVYANRVERQNLECLALNVYFEARGEPEPGRYAVAEVTMNRVASSRYPDTVCGVVYEKNWDALRKRYVSAFSWTEFESQPEPSGKQWDRARKIAEQVYFGRSKPKLAGATHYHAKYIRPSWARHQIPVARIGNHVFYK